MNRNDLVPAIILAAGASARMGSPKALLKIGGKTFLRHIVDVLRDSGISGIVIVLGSGADRIADSLAWFDGKVVVNQDWQRGQLTSLISGLDAIGGRHIQGVLVCPVDHPLATSRLIRSMCEAVEASQNIIIPVFKGIRGHPVIFPSRFIDSLRSAPLEMGARQLLRDHPDDILEIETDDEGVIRNIDTPEEYESFIV
jgi:molybdenum cofactor cytidylyltransferase